MEPLTVTALASVLIFKALEKSGEKLGEAAADQISKLINIIRSKFKEKGVEGVLAQLQENPSENNKSMFQMMLEMQTSQDETFAKNLNEVVNELKSNQQVSQTFLKGIDVVGSAEIGDVEQTATSGGSVKQEAATDMKIGGDLKIGNLKQQQG
ncbi:hypothetical protein HNI00_03280 [Thermoleptolyngbya oregonensis NK1-22]|uniref:Uncharacterized protein n=1 Tax=Thermoleptolyngbya oregonensis NK1-22 TaxID=2547457 RepID=A0AA97BBW7_9CYAN|nr:hypothetical protein [Thermoleptolyngbya oregonensis]WOB42294.1 hypothetical protein HNI00_03280 [Thermoleptolyngbya oregonensis NK1-22]